MATKKSGLGKGLDSLITDKVGKSSAKEVIKPDTMVDIDKVEPNKEQPRKNFDEDALLELSESIKQFGILQPLLVQDKDTYYEIIAGERRWRAAKLAGLKKVPVIIKKLTDQEIVEISLIENIQRENLNPIEEAIAYKRLLTEFNLKQDEVAERVSKSRSTITNSLRLLKLTEKVQQMLIDDMLSTGHVRTLIGIEDPELQYEVAMYIFDKKLSVRETETYVKKLLSGNTTKKTKENDSTNDLSFLYKDIEEKLKNALGTKTSIKAKNKEKGKIEIEYYSVDDLERITNILYSAKDI